MLTNKTTSSICIAFLLALFGASSLAYSQCDNNVNIDQGQTITLCGNIPNYLTASTGFTNYQWTGNVEGNNNEATITGTGWIYVSATDNNNCTSTDSIFISFWLINSNPIISSSNGEGICPEGGSTILSVNAYNPVSFEWSTGSTSNTIDVTTPGFYSVDVYDQNGCFMTDSIEIKTNIFTLEAIGGNTICQQQSVTLIASGGQTYNWSTGENGNSIVVAPMSNTNYQVTIEDGACIETLSVDISVHTMPSHTMPDTLYLMPGEIGYVTAPGNLDSYEWSPSDFVTSVTYPTTGYNGHLSGDVLFTGVQNSTTCVLMHNIYFNVINLTIPEGFSPNNDGRNDFFVIPEINPYNASLKIWNRWGDIVLEDDHYQNTWDGTCRGPLCTGSGPVPDGTYFYTLEVKERTITGNITIKR